MTPRCALRLSPALAGFLLALPSLALSQSPDDHEFQHAEAGKPFAEGMGVQGQLPIPNKGLNGPPSVEGKPVLVPVTGEDAKGPFPNLESLDPALQRILTAAAELVSSTEEAGKELGHLLEEAKALLADNPKKLQFGKLEDSGGSYSYNNDQITLDESLDKINPILVAATLLHELQHRYDFRLQKKLFNDYLYILETEKRAFKAGAIAFGLALNRLKPEDLKQDDLWYFRFESSGRIAYLLGEDSPVFQQMVEKHYREEEARGGKSSGRETAVLSIAITEEKLKKLENTIADLERTENIFGAITSDPFSARRLAATRDELRAQHLEAEVLKRRLRIARFEKARGMNLTTDTVAAPATPAPPLPGRLR